MAEGSIGSRRLTIAMESLAVVETSPASPTKVFGIFELFEKIALQLPLKDLLFAQGVCKTWNNNIHGSRPLQKAMFFEPATSDVVVFHEHQLYEISRYRHTARTSWPPDEDPSSWRLCPPHSVESIQGTYRPVYHTADYPIVTYHPTYDRGERSIKEEECGPQTRRTREMIERWDQTHAVFINPLLLSKFKWFREFFWEVDQAPGCFYELDLCNDTDLKASAQRPDASWRRMLITQPSLGFIDCTIPGYDAKRQREVDRVITPRSSGALFTMEELRVALAAWERRPLIFKGGDHLQAWTNGLDLGMIGRTEATEQDEQDEHDW
ncbi:hypothetical protein LTR85_001709 [Meristemomyces frigidus]|nr:hypothetical protein LTR85_001709 [Meristemomyces frigidus]